MYVCMYKLNGIKLHVHENYAKSSLRSVHRVV